MQLQELTLFLVEKVVNNREAVSVVLKEENDEILIDISVSESDLGRVIGKDGKMINAIRTIVQAAGYNQHQNNIKINVNKKENE